MRVRYLIEEYPEGEFNLSLVDSDGEAVDGTPSSYPTLADAQTAAEGAKSWRERPEWHGIVSQALNHDPDTGETWT